MDNIPTSVLKNGVEVLAGPISHLVNRSMAEGRVPANFKIGRVHPIHKGKGKPRKDPALVWQTGSNVEEVVRKLTEKAALFVDYTRSMGLSMNA
jgi:hypothetical protein